MIILMKRYFHILGSLLLASMLFFAIFPMVPNIIYPYANSVTGQETFNFATCSEAVARQTDSADSVVYRLQGSIAGWCMMRLTELDGSLSITCMVPRSLGGQTLSMRRFGLDLQPIKRYCVDHDIAKLAVVMISLFAIVIFFLLLGMRWAYQTVLHTIEVM